MILATFDGRAERAFRAAGSARRGAGAERGVGVGDDADPAGGPTVAFEDEFEQFKMRKLREKLEAEGAFDDDEGVSYGDSFAEDVEDDHDYHPGLGDDDSDAESEGGDVFSNDEDEDDLAGCEEQVEEDEGGSGGDEAAFTDDGETGDEQEEKGMRGGGKENAASRANKTREDDAGTGGKNSQLNTVVAALREEMRSLRSDLGESKRENDELRAELARLTGKLTVGTQQQMAQQKQLMQQHDLIKQHFGKPHGEPSRGQDPDVNATYAESSDRVHVTRVTRAPPSQPRSPGRVADSPPYTGAVPSSSAAAAAAAVESMSPFAASEAEEFARAFGVGGGPAGPPQPTPQSPSPSPSRGNPKGFPQYSSDAGADQDANAQTTAAKLASVVPPPPQRPPAPNASLWPQPFGPPKHPTGRTAYVAPADLPPAPKEERGLPSYAEMMAAKKHSVGRNAFARSAGSGSVGAGSFGGPGGTPSSRGSGLTPDPSTLYSEHDGAESIGGSAVNNVLKTMGVRDEASASVRLEAATAAAQRGIDANMSDVLGGFGEMAMGNAGGPGFNARFPETHMAGGLLLHSHTGRHESGGVAVAPPPPPEEGVNLPLRSAVDGATMSLRAFAAPTRR